MLAFVLNTQPLMRCDWRAVMYYDDVLCCAVLYSYFQLIFYPSVRVLQISLAPARGPMDRTRGLLCR